MVTDSGFQTSPQNPKERDTFSISTPISSTAVTWDFTGIDLIDVDEIKGRNGADTITGSASADTILGGKGDDALDGNGGDDTLQGENGNDSLMGQEGNDLLNGGKGNDNLIGGAGNDILDGQKGNDTLTGGTGVDQFVLSGDFDKDIITDFELNIDSLINTTDRLVESVNYNTSVGGYEVNFTGTLDFLTIIASEDSALESYLTNLESHQPLRY